MSKSVTSTASSYVPQAGDIVWLIFDPRVGHEQSGRRPALVVSPNELVVRTGLAIVCPITSKVKGIPLEVVLMETKTQGAVLPIHVRSVDIAARRIEFIEHAPTVILDAVRRRLGLMIG